MTGFVSEIVYRPILLPLLTLVWVICAAVCSKLTPAPVFLSVFPLIFFYYLLLRRQKINLSFCRFLLLICLVLFVAGFGAQKISLRRAHYFAARSQLTANLQFGKKVTLSGQIATFPQGSPVGWRLRVTPLNSILAGYGDLQLYLPQVQD